MCIMDPSYQANQQQSADPRGGGSIQTKTLSLTRILLLCGAIAGPLFIFTVLIQDYTRPGFDPRLDPLSLLSLGNWGWVQIVNFALAGVLNLLYAVCLWRRLHPGTALFMPWAVSLSSLCCRQRWRYSFGSSWHGRSVGGLSIAWRAPCLFYSSFLRVLVMQHLWREPYGLQR